jgi:hypothetical protein
VPWLGRWSASDPIGIAAGTNRFAYVRGNPNRFGDPQGTEEVQHLEDPEVREIVVDKVDVFEEGYKFLEALHSADGTQTHQRTFRDRLAYAWAVGQELHERAVDKTVEALEAGEYIFQNSEDAKLAIGSIANAAHIQLSTQQGRRDAAVAVGEGLLETVAEGLVAIDALQASAATGDVEGGADAVVDITSGALVASMAVNPVLGAARLAQSGVHLFSTWRAVKLSSRQEAVAGSASAEKAMVAAAERKAAAQSSTRAASAANAQVNAGHGYARKIFPGGTGRAFAGHGEFRAGAGTTVVPGVDLTLNSTVDFRVRLFRGARDVERA